MKIFLSLVVISLVLVACSQPENLPEILSEEEFQTQVAIAIAMTQDTYTSTPESTNTPEVTDTPKPTKTPRPTSTPPPTKTPTPKPIFDNSPKTLENMYLLGEQSTYNFPTITIYDVYTDSQFVVIRMKIENTGGIGRYGYINFVSVGSNGVILDPELFTGLDCELDYLVEVMDGATLDTCIVFEIPSPSTFTVMYAPYQLDQYNPERSLQWEISIK